MNRKEYLESLNQSSQSTKRSSGIQTSISTLSEYLELRRKCEEYERSGNVSQELIPEDYQLFDENFDMALQDILYSDEDFPRNEVERTIEMMRAVKWTWANLEQGTSATPDRMEFIKAIRYCYESCFEGGHPRNSCSTGGITVEIDIVDHLVSIQFSSINAIAYDGDHHDE